jgi:predicted lysophospholipase L1 biosynthesis ABC-type transport system permease subunit
MIAVVGTAAGLVLGLFAGRVVWGVIADHLGVLDDPVVSPVPAIVVAVTMIASAIAIAFVPAMRSRRLRPVELLRAE